jgi:hypothetical protein
MGHSFQEKQWRQPEEKKQASEKPKQLKSQINKPKQQA